jgi:hypothetical protein
MRRIVAPYLAYALLGAFPADAQGSQQLIEQCRLYVVNERDLPGTARASYNLGFCAGYLTSYLETQAYVAPDRSACLPDGMSVGQVVKIYMTWADKNPAMWHLPRQATVDIALKSAFGCRK